MSWKRQGSCPPERCKGRCCEHLGTWFKASDHGLIEMLRARGFRLFQKDDLVLADIPHRCQYLTDAGLCALHPAMNPNHNLPRRPQLCNDWPTEPAQIIADDCGFSFAWEEEALPIGG